MTSLLSPLKLLYFFLWRWDWLILPSFVSRSETEHPSYLPTDGHEHILCYYGVSFMWPPTHLWSPSSCRTDGLSVTLKMTGTTVRNILWLCLYRTYILKNGQQILDHDIPSFGNEEGQGFCQLWFRCPMGILSFTNEWKFIEGLWDE